MLSVTMSLLIFVSMCIVWAVPLEPDAMVMHGHWLKSKRFATFFFIIIELVCFSPFLGTVFQDYAERCGPSRQSQKASGFRQKPFAVITALWGISFWRKLCKSNAVSLQRALELLKEAYSRWEEECYLPHYTCLWSWRCDCKAIFECNPVASMVRISTFVWDLLKSKLSYF